MTLCLCSLSITLTFLGQELLGIMLDLLFVCENVAFFPIGMGPVCCVLTSESKGLWCLGRCLQRSSGHVIPVQ
ncbi:unnamed protein product [Brassica rapa subsp. narinosa]